MAKTALAERIPDYSRLSRTELALVLQLDADGLTQTAIAHKLGCSQATVSRTLADFGDTRNLAKAKTHNAALRLAEAAIKGAIQASDDGKPESALELLDRLEVAPKRQADSGGSKLQVLIGINASPIGPDPIPLSPPLTDVIHNVTVDKDLERNT